MINAKKKQYFNFDKKDTCFECFYHRVLLKPFFLCMIATNFQQFLQQLLQQPFQLQVQQILQPINSSI